MALSITNPQAEKVAKELSVLSGENLAQAIIHALEERLLRLKKKNSSVKNLEQEIMTISKRCSNIPDLDTRSPDEILGYNPNGGLY